MSDAPELAFVDVTLPLKESSPLVRPFILALGSLVGAALGAVAMGSRVTSPVALAIGAVLGAALVIAIGWRATRRIQAPPLVVTADALLLPKTRRARVQQRIALTDITNIEERALGKSKARRAVVIGTRTGFHIFGAAEFVADDAIAQLRAAVGQAVHARPDGAAHLAQMAAQHERSRATLQRKPYATMAFTAIVALVFLLEIATGALSDTVMLLQLGANAPALVAPSGGGAWWRLFSAAFLHLNALHILLNAFALLSFGALLEKLIATPRFVVAALAGGLGGNIATLWGTSAFSLGASSMIFGLVGALLVVNVRHTSQLPPGFYFGRERWLRVLVPNALLSLLPGVSALAHVGGFLAGAACALAFGRLEARTRAWAAAAGGLVLVNVIACGIAVHHAATTSRANAERDLLMSALASDQPTPRARLLLMRVASDPATDAELLERAHALCLRMRTQDDASALTEACTNVDARRATAPPVPPIP